MILILEMIIVILFIFSFSIFFHTLQNEKRFKNQINNMIHMNLNDPTASLTHDQKVPDLTLTTLTNQDLSLAELASEKPLFLLIANTQCGVCSLDIQDFAAESLAVGQFYNFVLVIDPESTDDMIPKHHNFGEILYSTEQFLKDFRVKLFPSFYLINMDLTLVATPPMTNKFNQYYIEEHRQLSAF